MPFLPPNQQRQSTEGKALKEVETTALVKQIVTFGIAKTGLPVGAQC